MEWIYGCARSSPWRLVCIGRTMVRRLYCHHGDRLNLSRMNAPSPASALLEPWIGLGLINIILVISRQIPPIRSRLASWYVFFVHRLD